jgi:hypothetical protein
VSGTVAPRAERATETVIDSLQSDTDLDTTVVVYRSKHVPDLCGGCVSVGDP